MGPHVLISYLVWPDDRTCGPTVARTWSFACDPGAGPGAAVEAAVAVLLLEGSVEVCSQEWHPGVVYLIAPQPRDERLMHALEATLVDFSETDDRIVFERVSRLAADPSTIGPRSPMARGGQSWR